MRKHKKVNKIKIGIVLFLIVLVFAITTVFGRYIYNTAREAYFSARQFYFTSDILKFGGTNYTYTNWGGLLGDVYEINFDLYSYDNKLSKLDYDLEYEVACESLSTDKIECSIKGTGGATSTTGVIYADTNISPVTILVNPKVSISEGETVKLKVTAKTEEPYQKEISCIFSLYVELPEGNTYSIEDVKDRDYAVLQLINRSETATQATLKFDPDELRLDLNDEIYAERVNTKTTADGKYINEITFNLPKESSKNVKFYKVDKTKDYTYPNAAGESAITVNY